MRWTFIHVIDKIQIENFIADGLYSIAIQRVRGFMVKNIITMSHIFYIYCTVN
jgi:hypothetical protein